MWYWEIWHPLPIVNDEKAKFYFTWCKQAAEEGGLRINLLFLDICFRMSGAIHPTNSKKNHFVTIIYLGSIYLFLNFSCAYCFNVFCRIVSLINLRNKRKKCFLFYTSANLKMTSGHNEISMPQLCSWLIGYTRFLSSKLWINIPHKFLIKMFFLYLHIYICFTNLTAPLK